jgi:hypothetical protein
MVKNRSGDDEPYIRHVVLIAIQSHIKDGLILGCASPKLRPACIFNNFIKLLATHSGDVVRRLRRSLLLLPNPAAASPSA